MFNGLRSSMRFAAQSMIPFTNINPEKYYALHRECNKYLNQTRDTDTFVFAACHTTVKSMDKLYLRNNNWLVMLGTTPNTITNYKQIPIINKDFAIYKGNEFKVAMIVNIDDPTQNINEITDYCHGGNPFNNNIIFRVNKSTNSHNISQYYDKIYFFRTIDGAISYSYRDKNFTGRCINYHKNGAPLCDYYCINGKRQCILKRTNDRGILIEQTQYVADLKHGLSYTFNEYDDNNTCITHYHKGCKSDNIFIQKMHDFRT